MWDSSKGLRIGMHYGYGHMSKYSWKAQNFKIIKKNKEIRTYVQKLEVKNDWPTSKLNLMGGGWLDGWMEIKPVLRAFFALSQ